MQTSTEFNENQFKSIYDESMRFHYWNLYRNDYILNFLRKNKIDNILDIGCGRGIVSDYLFKKGLKIQGVELGNTTPLSKSTVPIQYQTNALSLDSNLDIKSITLFDVIEHIEKPIEFLNQLIYHFNNLESIVLTVPSRMEVWSVFDDFNGHFKRYHLSQVFSDFKECKASIQFSDYFFQSLYWLMIINVKLFGNKREVDYSRDKPMTLIEKYIHKAFSKILKFTDYLFLKRSPGSSMIVYLKVKK
ncbi:MAG: methyltransferase domain-containing protein [Chitinophagales bacterium]|nr:methyltransferase domain-containing protein [Chitinophagales bacterium]